MAEKKECKESIVTQAHGSVLVATLKLDEKCPDIASVGDDDVGDALAEASTRLKYIGEKYCSKGNDVCGSDKCLPAISDQEEIKREIVSEDGENAETHEKLKFCYLRITIKGKISCLCPQKG